MLGQVPPLSLVALIFSDIGLPLMSPVGSLLAVLCICHNSKGPWHLQCPFHFFAWICLNKFFVVGVFFFLFMFCSEFVHSSCTCYIWHEWNKILIAVTFFYIWMIFLENLSNRQIRAGAMSKIWALPRYVKNLQDSKLSSCVPGDAKNNNKWVIKWTHF